MTPHEVPHIAERAGAWESKSIWRNMLVLAHVGSQVA